MGRGPRLYLLLLTPLRNSKFLVCPAAFCRGSILKVRRRLTDSIFPRLFLRRRIDFYILIFEFLMSGIFAAGLTVLDIKAPSSDRAFSLQIFQTNKKYFEIYKYLFVSIMDAGLLAQPCVQNKSFQVKIRNRTALRNFCCLV